VMHVLFSLACFLYFAWRCLFALFLWFLRRLGPVHYVIRVHVFLPLSPPSSVPSIVFTIWPLSSYSAVSLHVWNKVRGSRWYH